MPFTAGYCIAGKFVCINPLDANLNYGALTGGDEINQLDSTVPRERPCAQRSRTFRTNWEALTGAKR